jgi:hypothetical protein
MDLRPPSRAGARGAAATLACLSASMLAAFGVSYALNQAVPSMVDRGGTLPFYALLLAVALAGGRAWVAWMGRIAGARVRGAAAWAGATGLAAGLTLAARELTDAETRMQLVAQSGGRVLPMHLAFGLLFPGGALLVGGLSALTLSLALRAPHPLRLALRTAVVAGLVFLAVDAGMDALGWRVGGPGAERRFTMLAVAALGCLLSAAAAGATLGRGLAAARGRAAEPPLSPAGPPLSPTQNGSLAHPA